ncbi:hypothetical protein BGZ68_001415 [Mortierella alpina]|nr:hypothetical protein BGZ68_001415 [Mortierella alpina]
MTQYSGRTRLIKIHLTANISLLVGNLLPSTLEPEQKDVLKATAAHRARTLKRKLHEFWLPDESLLQSHGVEELENGNLFIGLKKGTRFCIQSPPVSMAFASDTSDK